MEAIQKSIDEMSKLFSKRMAEFQKELDSSHNASSSTSPVSKLSNEFSTFKNFVIFAIQNLQLQMQTLSKQFDDMEMRSRRKMLLVHRLPEEENEDISKVIHKLLSEQLAISNLSPESFVRCHRMGRYNSDKPRPVLLKLKDISIRDSIWQCKTKLKGTGITISEFLTKSRHDIFLIARQRCGISKCWTNNGRINVIGSDGSRHCVASTVELDAILGPAAGPSSSTASAQHKAGNPLTKTADNISSARTRRPLKQK